MHRRLMSALVVVAAAVAALPLSGVSAAKKEKQVDRIWVSPDIASFKGDRIALLLVASYDHNYPNEKQVEAAVGQNFQATGYRWISASSAREMLRNEATGDSLINALKQGLLKEPRVDSLAAPGLCARLRCQALLSFRIDLWEQRNMEWNVAGKPSTTIQLKAALVDSAGKLLWSAAGSQTAEGQYNDPNSNPMVADEAGVQRKNLEGLQAPSPPLALAPLMTRWVAKFPARSAPSPAK